MFFFIKGVIARLFIVVLATLVFLSIGLAGEEQRKPPAARTSGTLGPQVMRRKRDSRDDVARRRGGRA